MWISTNKGFLSIVRPSAMRLHNHPARLLVRARRKGDIEAAFRDLFPELMVERTPARDYLFRALIPADIVAQMVAKQIINIDYNNFKNSVQDKKLHDAYAAVWHIMAKLQPTPPYSGVRGSL